MKPTSDTALKTLFDTMFPRVQAFLNDTLAREEVDDHSYVEGSKKIDFYASSLRHEARLKIEEHTPTAQAKREREFEEALFQRLLQPRQFNLLVLLGGLGAGKSTTVKYLLRRFDERRQLVMGTFNCTCSGCYRSPIYLDFRSLDAARALRRGTIVPDVFHEMRLATYRQIVKEWLLTSGNNVQLIEANDHDFVVLRRLFIANDLLHQQGSEFPGLAQLHERALRLEAPLTSIKVSDRDLIKLINIYKPHAMAYHERIEKVMREPDDSLDFMRLTFKFYLYRCNRSNPLNLIVLDNLDQLPTKHIEELLRQLHNIAEHAGGLPLLVPLRPSSIQPIGFVREIVFRYHYGPDNFQMILSRLERHILTQSRDALRIPRSKSKNRPFIAEPTDDEIDALLVVTYLYAQIMVSGISGGRAEQTLKIHEDHRFLRSININEGILFGLAETCDALVGACCRYGLDLMKRFYDNAYANPRMMLRSFRAREAFSNQRQIRLTYADLVTSLLRNPIGDPDHNRVTNLFEPTRVTTNPGWPTLVKLRILSLLIREKRQDVHTIVQRLALFGIPSELTIAALNSLQDKFRLLLWFSTNRPLSIEEIASLKQDVVISEHGEAYFRRVAGDFEYVWYCATALNDRQYSHGGLQFTVKLNDYKLLVQRIGDTEWKQIAFYRLRSGCLPDTGGMAPAARMEVLNVLYSSLGRALLGTHIAMRAHEQTRGLTAKLSRLVKEICEQILFWQRRYRIAFGSTFYLSVYQSQISALQLEILELSKHSSSATSEIAQYLAEVQRSWLENSETISGPELGLRRDVPPEDIITILSKYGRGLIPSINSWVSVVDKHRKTAVFMANFLKGRQELADLLSNRLPTSTEVEQSTSYLLSDLDAVIAGGAEMAATGEKTLRWCVEERKVLRDIKQSFEHHHYDVPEGCSMERMSELKLRSNSMTATLVRLARHLGVVDTLHLDQKWQGLFV